MKQVLKILIEYYRTTLSISIFLVIAGATAYISMPKEAAPYV